MVMYNFKIEHFLFSQLSIFCFLMVITYFFSILNPFTFTSAISFNFTSFSSSDSNITYERAFAENQVIQLTGNRLNFEFVGRATYFKPMRLWDKDSGKLTNFTTHFSFAIDSKKRSVYGDGIAFFLAPVGSKIPFMSKGGSTMGLCRGNQALDSVDNPFVAVEFDIYSNEYWDPPGEHVASTGNSSAIHTIYSWDFSSSLEIDETTNNPKDPVSSPNIPAPKQRKNNTLGLAMGLGFGGFVLVGGLAMVLFSLWKRNRRDKGEDDDVLDDYIDEEFERGRGPKKFPYNELARATNDFNDKEKLGQGGFGAVYKGLLRDSNTYVAVKRVVKGSKQGIKEYASEVKIISQLRHRNLVQLIGWCHERKELLLVYDFMPNGSLDSHLFQESVLIWELRYKVAQGLASALLYLQEEWEQCVLHRDIKSSNIMLDSNFNAKLGDFGLARLVDHAKGSTTTDLAGTKGYIAPEYFTTNKATKESDVYSFGIVALEIASGRRAINHMAIEDHQVVTEMWVRELHRRGELIEAADPRLGGNFDELQMERLIIVGLWCAHPDYKLRPSIRQAIQVLNFEALLPLLPFDMPGPT
ncbi:L-type lectin-domain containing receptor kinase IX.1 [Quercus suber]|uniref:L-type lectin-domain containing receptor kinase IX.1 n=1 Tax=Quercus suber TaxID=58331 RepID=UPI0032DFF4AD